MTKLKIEKRDGLWYVSDKETGEWAHGDTLEEAYGDFFECGFYHHFDDSYEDLGVSGYSSWEPNKSEHVWQYAWVTVKKVNDNILNYLCLETDMDCKSCPFDCD
jgi:hypothetical protein